MDKIDWQWMLKAAVAVVGLIEWVKNFPGKKATLVPWILLPLAAYGYAFSADGGIWTILPNGAFFWGLCQLGYPIVVKLPAAALDWIKSKVGSAP
jgi:hypothetical protein